METKNNDINPDLDHNETLLHWQTPEFIPIHRGKTWYIVAGLIMAGIIAYALYTGSITMAIVFVLLGGTFLMTNKQQPRIIDVEITKLGIKYDKKFYPYNMINAFWIVYHPPYVRTLYVRLGGKSYKYIKIELNHQSPIEVRHLLSGEVPEIEGMEERSIDVVARILRLQ